MSIRVARINVTPVKSLRLHHPDEVELGPDGAREDGGSCSSTTRGGSTTGSGTRASYARPRPGIRRAATAVTMPDGTLIEDEVVPSGAGGLEVYGGRSGTVVTAPGRTRFSDLVGRSLTLVERDDGAWATDSRPATLVSRASVASSTATAAGSGCCSSWTGRSVRRGGLAEPTRPGGGGDAARR